MWLHLMVPGLVLITFPGATARFDTKQPVLQPIIPRQHGLTIELADCGGPNSKMCKTECGMTFSLNLDLRARLAWTDEFDAHEDWDASEDKVLAIPESMPMAISILDRFMEQSIASTTAWKQRRMTCNATLFKYNELISQGHQRLNSPLARFVRASFGDIGKYYNKMVFDRIKLWYAEDIARRIRDGIETGYPSISFSGREDDPCDSAATDLTISLRESSIHHTLAHDVIE